MSIEKIKNLEEIISKYINKDQEIIDTNITNLTAPGENYGSQIYKVDIKLKNQNNETEILHVVAKQIPNSEYYQEVFNIQVTFNAEKEFYNTIVPTIHEFQKKMGTKILDAFPKFYGARNNLNGTNNRVDKDALIVIENLKTSGYQNLDRYVGFDLDTSKLILKYLAQFHAATLALKLKQPEVFDEKIKPNLNCFLPRGVEPILDHEYEELVNLVQESSECKHFEESLKESLKYFGSATETFREPFCTVVHKDFWVNNIMIKFGHEKAEAVRFVDFQLYSYDTPAGDLFFFLFTSVQTDVLKQHLDDLLDYYHKNFIQTLSEHKCPIDMFSYEKFMGEMVACTKYEFGKLMFMFSFIVRGPKGGHLNVTNPAHIPKLNTKHMNKEDKERLFWILLECERRGWLKA